MAAAVPVAAPKAAPESAPVAAPMAAAVPVAAPKAAPESAAPAPEPFASAPSIRMLPCASTLVLVVAGVATGATLVAPQTVAGAALMAATAAGATLMAATSTGAFAATQVTGCASTSTVGSVSGATTTARATARRTFECVFTWSCGPLHEPAAAQSMRYACPFAARLHVTGALWGSAASRARDRVVVSVPRAPLGLPAPRDARAPDRAALARLDVRLLPERGVDAVLEGRAWRRPGFGLDVRERRHRELELGRCRDVVGGPTAVGLNLPDDERLQRVVEHRALRAAPRRLDGALHHGDAPVRRRHDARRRARMRLRAALGSPDRALRAARRVHLHHLRPIQAVRELALLPCDGSLARGQRELKPQRHRCVVRRPSVVGLALPHDDAPADRGGRGSRGSRAAATAHVP